MEHRIKALKDKHAATAAQIALLELMPRNNYQQIQSLKKKKLKFKDEIVRLENPNRLTAPKKKKKSERSAFGAQKIQSREVSSPLVSNESGDDIGLAA